jgi:hypothetical protein
VLLGLRLPYLRAKNAKLLRDLLSPVQVDYGHVVEIHLLGELVFLFFIELFLLVSLVRQRSTYLLD